MHLRDLDEYTEDELIAELQKRISARKNGLCTYCNRPSTTTPCRFPARHSGKEPRADLAIIVNGHTYIRNARTHHGRARAMVQLILPMVRATNDLHQILSLGVKEDSDVVGYIVKGIDEHFQDIVGFTLPSYEIREWADAEGMEIAASNQVSEDLWHKSLADICKPEQSPPPASS